MITQEEIIQRLYMLEKQVEEKEITQRLYMLEKQVHELSNAVLTLSALVHQLDRRINSVGPITPPNVRYKVS